MRETEWHSKRWVQWTKSTHAFTGTPEVADMQMVIVIVIVMHLKMRM